MFLPTLLLTLTLSTLSTIATPAPIATGSTRELPTVDLGYTIHRASSYNSTLDVYTFTNIRFAAAPIGALRFAAPAPPPVDRSVVRDGSEGFSCIQGSGEEGAAGIGEESEDCLFLDVIVPRAVLEGEVGEKVPVLTWIYGGGYTTGSKTSLGSAYNLLQSSPSPVVYVAPNYRLGIYGFLAGPSFTLNPSTIQNAGIHDQQFALRWVQTYIHHFNGQKDAVTLLGGSAGAGGVMHLLTAYGGTGERPLFRRAVPMGPGFFLVGGHEQAEATYRELVESVGCAGEGVECVRRVEARRLRAANRALVAGVRAPRVGPGPVVDGGLVVDFPPYLLAQGRFHAGIDILITADVDEGTPFVNTSSTLSFSDSVLALYPHTTPSSLATFLALYPPPSSTTPYTTPVQRFSTLLADTIFHCNSQSWAAATARSSSSNTDVYSALFNVGTGQHGTSLYFLLSDEDEYRHRLQGEVRAAVMRFVVSGSPNPLGGGGAVAGVVWPRWNEKGAVLEIGDAVSVGEGAGERLKAVCEWWVKGLVLS